MDGFRPAPTPVPPRYEPGHRIVSLDAFRRFKSRQSIPRPEFGSAAYHDAAIRDDPQTPQR